METYEFGEDLPTCPHCSRRTYTLHAMADHNIERCKPCDYTFRTVDEDE